jgi:HAMP domain-containing protein
MSYNIFVSIALILAVLFSFAAWFNTQVIIRELTDIKRQLHLKEEKKSSFLDQDLDQEK